VSERLSYSLVTPFRDEGENLPRLAAAVAGQTTLPDQWILVDTGSTDESVRVATELASAHDWVSATRLDGDGTMRPGAPIVRAFKLGAAALRTNSDIIVKLDADVSFDPDYFSSLLEAFTDDPRLGIASGRCLELESGEWRPKFVTGDHVRGATRAYRQSCLEEVGPLPEEVGWDGVDELKAAVLGWRTRTIPSLSFRHHRPVGARDGARSARWLAEGRCVYYMGYRPSYVLARSVGRAVRDRDPGAFSMLASYIWSALRRAERYPDERVRKYLRTQQRLRFLPRRSLESLGLWRTL
jgi:glycosyltransferase involved in cell wall biosynthesis